MHDALSVYKRAEMQFDKNGEIIVPDDYKLTITVFYDEKPGIQAVANTTEDHLRPTPENGEAYRDSEYKRLGTVSLPAGVDLLTGETIPSVPYKNLTITINVRIDLRSLNNIVTQNTRDFGVKMPYALLPGFALPA